ncbi:MAG: flavodoxin family protein [Thermodesulfobacteriota bacterium]
MKILGISASYNEQGNSAILTQQALRGAEEAGAQVELVRLPDLTIDDCRGCALCLYRDRECFLKDDLHFLFAKMREADAFILGTPCHFQEANSMVKRLIDRSFYRTYIGDLQGKAAAILVSHSKRGWTDRVFPQITSWLRGLGVHVVNQSLFHSQYPSEVLLYRDQLEKAHAMGQGLVRALREKDYTFQGKEGLCPLCHDNVIRIRPGRGEAECADCHIPATLTVADDGGIKVTFAPEALAQDRYRSESMARHFSYHSKPALAYTRATRKRAKEGKAALEGGFAPVKPARPAEVVD